MGQDPNQPYANPYGQPPSGGVPPQGGEYYQGNYQQQQSGYQQYQQPPSYGQPGAQGPYNTASPLGPTTINMEPNVAAGLSYFTWVAGLIFFLLEKQNRFVRFNAMQSILLSVASIVISIVLEVIAGILSFTFLGAVISPLLGLITLGFFVLWIICLVNAFQGKYYKLPIIGDYAERWANSSSGTPMM